ncbi:Even-skipped homeobox 1 [Cichlidogyrus casuarinus]|uniref:Even-skipped homeobox 1 n=1 Tax=Cichlidogyrus casuarinus TaxID=1844966 RepID=A0ABD2PRY5_9PLAT
MDIFKPMLNSSSSPDRDLMTNLFKGELPNFESFQLLAASILHNSGGQPKDDSLVKSDEDSSNVGTSSDYDTLKRYRTSYTQYQTKVLEESFHRERYISRPQRAQLAKELKLPENTIKVWFQNRRMKEKRQSMMLPNVACKSTVKGKKKRFR